MLNNEQKAFILSAPSGAGKNTIIQEILKKRNDLIYSISTTTRPHRGNEKNGGDYHFIPEDEFKKQINDNKFLEWAMVLDNYYGTTKKEIQDIFAQKKHAILDLDVHGAMQVKQNHPEAVIIFIMPPSLEVLRERLALRGTDSEEEIEKRLKLAEKEMAVKDKYDYILTNNEINKTVEELDSIISKFALV